MYADAGKRVHMYGCKQICSMFCLHLIKTDTLKALGWAYSLAAC